MYPLLRRLVWALVFVAAPAVAMDMPIVLTPSRMTQSIADSPSAVTVINREMIEATGVRKLTDVLRLVPGLTSGSRFGNLAVPTYHGLGDSYNRRIQVLVDGRSAWQPLTGGVFWLNMPVPIENIDRIEVIRGPNGASHGSSAFMATINIITNHTSETQGSKVHVTQGVKGISDLYAHHGGATGRVGYSLSLSRQEDNGFDNLYDTRRDDVLLGRVDLAATGRDEVLFQFGVSDSEYGAGDGSFYSPYRPLLQKDDFQHLQWTRAFGPGNDLQVTFSRHYFKNDHKHLVGPITVPPVGYMVFDYTYDGTRYDTEIQHSLVVDDQLRVVWGIGQRNDEAYSPAYFNTNDTLTNRTLLGFGQMEYRFTPSVIANLGMMYEDSDLVSPEIAPRAALILHPVDGHTVRFAYNSGTRQPVLREEVVRQSVWNEAGTFRLYKEYASGGLRPEKMESVEVGYRFDGVELMLDTRLYQEKATDLVTAYFTAAPAGLMGYYNNYTQVIDYRNEDAVTIQGFEMETEWRPVETDQVRLAYANTQISMKQRPPYLDYSVSAPRHQISLLYTHDFGSGWKASVFYNWVDEMAWLAQPMLKAYERLDVRLAKRTRLDGTLVTVELVGQGLTGDHADFDPAAKWTPLYFVRAKLDF